VLYGIAGAGRGFAPTMALKARVTNAAAFPAGSTIGYARAARLEEDRVLANISLGYSNGYVRQFTGRARVLIRGRLLPVLGKISMNTVVVDVSSLPEVQTGDEAVAFGAQDGAEITVAMIEAQSGTIMADLYTDWGHRNPRVLRD
jgi:alanine racemase